MGFVRTRQGLDLPDVELLFTPGAFDSRTWFPGWRDAGPSVFSVSAFLMRPKSRGSVELRSSDPLDAPRITLGALADDEDVATLVSAVRMIRSFMATGPAANIVDREILPGRDHESDKAIASHLRQTVRTMQHPTSTCMMGRGPDAVVDPQLRVHGIDCLRVVDASIMPQIIGGHTNAPTIMIGEKGADLILDRAQSR